MKILLTLLTLLPLAASCAGTWYPHRFLPAPLEVQVGVEGDAEAQASVLISVLGIRRSDSGAGTPAQVELLMQVNNLGQLDALLLPGELSLVTADLLAFDVARVEPPVAAPVPTGGQAQFAVSFPLPPGRELGDLDLRGIHLKWTLEFGDRRATTGVTFDRQEEYWNQGVYYPAHYSHGYASYWHHGSGHH